ncbi:MAG: hypothetical protein R3E10_12720 [Gemmatimonadota bacterium]
MVVRQRGSALILLGLALPLTSLGGCLRDTMIPEDAGVPSLERVEPNGITTGSSRLTVIGAGFVQRSVVRWNGADRPTRFQSPTRLEATLTSADVAQPGVGTVTVFTPPPSGGLSASLSVPITAAASRPQIGGITPATVPAGAQGIELVVRGTGFDQSTLVELQPGGPLVTQFVDAQTLRAPLPWSIVVRAGTYNVRARNPTRASDPIPFPVVALPPILVSVAPDSFDVGVPLHLVVRGAHFQPTSQVNWNGSPLITEYVSFTELSAEAPIPTVDEEGRAGVAVETPFLTTVPSGVRYLKPVIGPPQIDSLAPVRLIAHEPAATPLRIRGTRFSPSTVARWNGAERATRFFNGGSLEITVTVQDQAAVGTATLDLLDRFTGLSSAPVTVPIELAPAPRLGPVLPDHLDLGEISTTTFKVNGVNFTQHAVGLWNGEPRVTVYVHEREVHVTVTPADQAVEGEGLLQVADTVYQVVSDPWVVPIRPRS